MLASICSASDYCANIGVDGVRKSKKSASSISSKRSLFFVTFLCVSLTSYWVCEKDGKKYLNIPFSTDILFNFFKKKKKKKKKTSMCSLSLKVHYFAFSLFIKSPT